MFPWVMDCFQENLVAAVGVFKKIPSFFIDVVAVLKGTRTTSFFVEKCIPVVPCYKGLIQLYRVQPMRPCIGGGGWAG